MAFRGRFSVSLPAQSDPEIGRELIEVRYEDGSAERIELHDYERLYALPGAYEQIVSERLRCRSPAVLGALLGRALDSLGRSRAATRLIDLAAGNGVSGEALVAQGIHPVLGTDIVASARAAALRDRPEVYDQYLTLDLLALTDAQSVAIRALRADALQCVAPVGDAAEGQVPTAVLAAAVALLEPDAVVAYLHDPGRNPVDVVDATFWRRALGDGVTAQALIRHRYVHRQTVNGAPFEMIGVVWRVVRGPA